MAKNDASLNNAKQGKNDEFYTRLQEIEQELYYYQNLFEGKTVLCNCDDPFESKFFEYFVLHFNTLKLKKLICTCYAHSFIAWNQLTLFDVGEADNPMIKTPYKAVVTKVYDKTGNGYLTMEDIKALFKSKENKLTKLKGDGDFRSEECVELLKEADIVVTNPPFSLFRDFVAQLLEYDKKFLLICNLNAVTYKELFPLVKEGKIWFGASIHSGDRPFYVPDSYPLNAAGCGVDGEGRRFIKVKGVRWFTNMDFKQRHEELRLFMNYTPEAYPKYENYEGIDVSEVKFIPYDYDGVIGVPITFMDKYCPEQFEILDCCEPAILLETLRKDPKFKEYPSRQIRINGEVCQKRYHRLLIRRRK